MDVPVRSSRGVSRTAD